jgi:signal transduction histidine kinase
LRPRAHFSSQGLDGNLSTSWEPDPRRGSNLTPKQIEFAQTIHRAGAELLALINDVLDLSTTGYAASFSASEQGADVLAKPYRESDLLGKLRHLLPQKNTSAGRYAN